MKLLKIILIDDEIDSLENLQQKLTNFCADVEVVGICQEPETAAALIELHQPDVVFLDIEMPRLSGFKLLESIGHHDFEIVFVTAYNHYAIDAIRIKAFDYLTKPISISDLENCVQRLLTTINEKKKENNSLSAMPKDIRSNPFDKIAIPTMDGLEFVEITTILYIAAQSNYSKVYFNNQKEILVSKTLAEFEEVLKPYRFFRTHHSYLINMAYIQKYSKADGGMVILTNGKKVEISRRKKEDFLNQFLAIKL